jgi:hypothetical protein
MTRLPASLILCVEEIMSRGIPKTYAPILKFLKRREKDDETDAQKKRHFPNLI